jgi:hypothetical protein
LLAENFFRIFLPALESARDRQVRLSWFTVFNLIVTARELISIFIGNTPKIFNIILILSAAAELFQKNQTLMLKTITFPLVYS